MCLVFLLSRLVRCRSLSHSIFEMLLSPLLRAAASTTVRAVKRKRTMLPTRAALTLTPSAVNRVKELVGEQQGAVSHVGFIDLGLNRLILGLILGKIFFACFPDLEYGLVGPDN